MRGSFSRVLRFSRFAAVLTAALFPAFAGAQEATQTSLSAETHDLNGRTQAIVSVKVTSGADGTPASGPVVIRDGSRRLAGAALDAQGSAKVSVSLAAGAHALRAEFVGDGAHQASASDVASVMAQTAATPGFTVSVNPVSLSLAAGQSATVVASVNPVNASALTAPMFVTLSCSGFPDQSTCAFTPENVEILPNATAPVTSSMVVTTQAGTGSAALHKEGPRTGNAVELALLLPGALGFAGLAFATRRRRWLSRLSVMGLVGLVTILGATGCAPRYNYFNHGPPHNLPTPAGSYTLTVSAQSSNGVTASTQSTSVALVVK